MRIITIGYIDSKHDPGCLGKYHHLNHCAQRHCRMVKSLFDAIIYRTVSKCRRIAFFHFLNDSLCSAYIQISILLPRKACIRQVLRRCTGTDCHKRFFNAGFPAQLSIRTADCLGQCIRHFSRQNGFSNSRTDLAQLHAILHIRKRSKDLLDAPMQAAVLHETAISICCSRKTIRYRYRCLCREFSQRRSLAAYQSNIFALYSIKP